MGIKGTSSAEAAILLLLSFIALSILFTLYQGGALLGPSRSQIQSTVSMGASPNATVTVESTETTLLQTTIPVGTSALYNYTLSLINSDRKTYGLAKVTLSNVSSGQQHADSLLDQGYFSHWDTYGMKPYMRYTLLGGRGSVSENVAYRYSALCKGSDCIGDINVTSSIQDMEYGMMNNDSQCCNNGHRENILSPDHNRVSIGVAYNSSRVYLVEDFEDAYVNWQDYGPNAATDEMYVSGALPSSASLYDILVSYDPPVENMTNSQLAMTSSYGYGTEIAGIVSSPIYYYNNLTSIAADQYSIGDGKFDVSFNLKNLIGNYGSGEYTMLVWLKDSEGNGFLGSTFTVFVGSDGRIYLPRNV